MIHPFFFNEILKGINERIKQIKLTTMKNQNELSREDIYSVAKDLNFALTNEEVDVILSLYKPVQEENPKDNWSEIIESLLYQVYPENQAKREKLVLQPEKPLTLLDKLTSLEAEAREELLRLTKDQDIVFFRRDDFKKEEDYQELQDILLLKEGAEVKAPFKNQEDRMVSFVLALDILCDLNMYDMEDVNGKHTIHVLRINNGKVLGITTDNHDPITCDIEDFRQASDMIWLAKDIQSMISHLENQIDTIWESFGGIENWYEGYSGCQDIAFLNDIFKTTDGQEDEFTKAILDMGLINALEEGLRIIKRIEKDFAPIVISESTLDEVRLALKPKELNYAHFSFGTLVLKNEGRSYLFDCRTSYTNEEDGIFDIHFDISDEENRSVATEDIKFDLLYSDLESSTLEARFYDGEEDMEDNEVLSMEVFIFRKGKGEPYIFNAVSELS